MPSTNHTTPVDNHPATGWRRSSRSILGNDCVEVLARADEVRVRDSKAHYGPELRLHAHDWTTFLQELRAMK